MAPPAPPSFFGLLSLVVRHLFKRWLTVPQGTSPAAPAAAVPAAPATVTAPGAAAPFPPVKQIRAGVLDVGYAELGPAW
ncbi:hypothetical protein RFN58_22845 [Streptomyces iakyrus]|uniref:hypothetical protein n=1 Tax=Streptomyces iakyrus TaxID=68219 RepID=UPI00052799B5|nr:hypothetical protein [Streptomyces iakyrus]